VRVLANTPAEVDIHVEHTQVVDLTPADLAEIHDLRCRAADFFAETGDDPPTLESLRADLEDLPDGYTSADETMYRAYDSAGTDGAAGADTEPTLVAYAEVLRGWPDRDGWIVGILLVDAARRGEGIGPQVVEAIARDADEARMHQLVVGVIASRDRSLAFWKREGFTSEVLRRPIRIGDEPHEVVRLVRGL
jgi:GNAT superfamily N-acetyltransferase